MVLMFLIIQGWENFTTQVAVVSPISERLCKGSFFTGYEIIQMESRLLLHCYGLFVLLQLLRKTVFPRLSKHLEFRQKYSATRRIFNSLLGVWISPRNTVSCVWYITSRFFFKMDFSSLPDKSKHNTTYYFQYITYCQRHINWNRCHGFIIILPLGKLVFFLCSCIIYMVRCYNVYETIEPQQRPYIIVIRPKAEIFILSKTISLQFSSRQL